MRKALAHDMTALVHGGALDGATRASEILFRRHARWRVRIGFADVVEKCRRRRSGKSD
jgi:hypothetical protein